MNKLLRILILLLLASPMLMASAQTVPALMNYQGRLANPDGSPLASGNYQLTFRLYDAVTNGNLIWGPQEFDGSAVTGHGPLASIVQGYFNVLLGPVDIADSALDAAFGDTNRFVEIAISNQPPIFPRQQILATPFAFQATSSASFTGSLSGDVTGSQNATSVANVGGLPAATVASGANAANNASSANVVGTLVRRDSNGDFSGRIITASNIRGDGGGLTDLDAGQLATGTIPAMRLPTSLTPGTLDVSGAAQLGSLSVNGATQVGNLTVNSLSNPDGGNGELTLQGQMTPGNDFHLENFANRFRIHSGGTEMFTITPAGRIGIGQTSPGTKFEVAGTITCTTLTQTSDRNQKENFQPVSPAEVLNKVAAMPITRWNFKEEKDVPHVGPMAQDFYAAFGLGTDDRHIATVDAGGVSLAAIQGLNQKLEEKLKEKDLKIANLEKRLESLEKIVLNGKPN